jgi:hypothetical protein
MNYDRCVSAVMESQAISTADDPLIELQMPNNSVGEVISVEIGAAEGADPVAEIQELQLYVSQSAGTGGTALTETLLNGDGTIVGAALRNLTAPGGTPEEIYGTAWNVRFPWLWVPVPSKRPILKGFVDADAFGILFPTAPDAALTLSATIVWTEVG